MRSSLSHHQPKVTSLPCRHYHRSSSWECLLQRNVNIIRSMLYIILYFMLVCYSWLSCENKNVISLQWNNMQIYWSGKSMYNQWNWKLLWSSMLCHCPPCLHVRELSAVTLLYLHQSIIPTNSENEWCEHWLWHWPNNQTNNSRGGRLVKWSGCICWNQQNWHGKLKEKENPGFLTSYNFVIFHECENILFRCHLRSIGSSGKG